MAIKNLLEISEIIRLETTMIIESV